MDRNSRTARVRLRKGETLTIVVQPGFVELQQRSKAGLTCITIPNSKLFTILRWLVPTVKSMAKGSSDPVQTLRDQAFIDLKQSRARRRRRK